MLSNVEARTVPVHKSSDFSGGSCARVPHIDENNCHMAQNERRDRRAV